jgi:hypothetical protein
MLLVFVIQSAKRTLAHAKSIVSFKEFSMHPLSAFILAVIMLMSIVRLANGVEGLFIGGGLPPAIANDWLRLQPELVASLITSGAVPLNVIALAWVGRWIGLRSPPVLRCGHRPWRRRDGSSWKFFG